MYCVVNLRHIIKGVEIWIHQKGLWNTKKGIKETSGICHHGMCNAHQIGSGATKILKILERERTGSGERQRKHYILSNAPPGGDNSH